MNPTPALRGPAAFWLAVWLACSVPTHASAQAVPADTAAPAPADIARTQLQRAAMERSAGNLAGVISNLEGLDWHDGALFGSMDRAAFLLGQAYLELGSHGHFVSLARAVATWQRSSVYTDWVAYQLAVEENGRARTDSVTVPAAAGHEAADTLTAGVLLDQGKADAALALTRRTTGERSALVIYLEALALAARGASNDAQLIELSSADTASTLGRDLAGVALLQRATHAIERGDDAETLLERVPSGSRYSARALHMLGLLLLERGAFDRAHAVLETITATDSCYEGHREITLALAGWAIDDGRWTDAQRSYSELDQDWLLHRQSIETLLESDSFDVVWESWRSQAHESEALLLDGQSAQLLAEELAAAAAHLEAHPDVPVPAADAAQGGASSRWHVPPPPSTEWAEVEASRHSAEDAAYEVESNRRAIEAELARLESHRGYLGHGLDRVHREQGILKTQSTLLDSLRVTLDALEQRLQSVRDASTRRVLVRATRTLATCADNILWIDAMRHFHVEGPNRLRPLRVPPGVPSPDSLTLREEALTRTIRTLVARFAEEWPALIARSYDEAWRPGMIDRARVQGLQTHRHLAWADTIETGIDDGLRLAAASQALRDMQSLAISLERTADSTRSRHQDLRAHVARGALERKLVAMLVEREAIDYGLAVSSYGLSVGLGRDTADSTLIAHDAVDSSGVFTGAEMDDPQAVAWRGTAIGSLEQFLARHPQSFARGEMRFRLADLLLIDARYEFQEQMAAYLEDQRHGGSSVRLPVLSHEPALNLYKAILAEDPDFDHTDAVLFNAGMILADGANPDAAPYFARLVADHPDSDYGQEAHLRMGDMAFNAKRFDEGIDHYRHASVGPDPSLKAISLYKMGWAHFNQDHFMDATDAFRSVLDLYASAEGDLIEADIAGESESYMVHALSRAGGADVFAEYFDRIGERDYERGVLMAMGQHFRRFSLYSEAAGADELSLQRFPDHPDALLSAKRLIETHERAEHSALARDARLAWAPRFTPSSDWARAQASDSVRAAGSAFARGAWEFVALHHHRVARAENSSHDWREALQLYRTLLSHWPQDDEAPTFQLYAGEASMHLDAYAEAIEHYSAAAVAGTDSIAELALRQRVAVSDRWYESTRHDDLGEATPLGSDSLARVVLGFADELIGHFPDHDGADDIQWRQGNLTFAHGWYERAAADFERMVSTWPGDARAPYAAGLRADALFRIERFEEAGAAYENALAISESAGLDSLAARAAQAIPVAYFRHAESAVAANGTNYALHADLFANVAARWPDYEHAHVAQYRSALARLEARQPMQGVQAMQALIHNFPESEYVQDAHLHIAKTWEAEEQPANAANAYAEFARRYAGDSAAPDAWLKAADLYDAAGLEDRAEQQRLAYIRQYPADQQSAIEILDVFARREVAGVTPGSAISGLLSRAPATQDTTGSGSYIADYLRRAAAHPELAANDLRAQVLFLRAEEVRSTYLGMRLTQPLPASIASKQALLDSMLTLYRASIDFGAAEWAHASAFRIGHVLVAFGEALEQSQRPDNLAGEDLLAYDDVLRDESQPFYDRGEGVWEDLLRQKGMKKTDDAWIELTRESLWKRLAYRFYFKPEVEFPLIAGSAPKGNQPVDIAPLADAPKASGGKERPSVAQREGDSR